jgi:hypothetical protein
LHEGPQRETGCRERRLTVHDFIVEHRTCSR